MITRLGGGTKKYRRVFGGRGFGGRNEIVRERTRVNRNTRYKVQKEVVKGLIERI